MSTKSTPVPHARPGAACGLQRSHRARRSRKRTQQPIYSTGHVGSLSRSGIPASFSRLSQHTPWPCLFVCLFRPYPALLLPSTFAPASTSAFTPTASPSLAAVCRSTFFAAASTATLLVARAAAACVERFGVRARMPMRVKHCSGWPGCGGMHARGVTGGATQQEGQHNRRGNPRGPPLSHSLACYGDGRLHVCA